MDARTPRTDERTFQMQAQNPIVTGDRAGRRDCGPHLRRRVGDQGWQAAGRPKATVRLGDGAHAVGGRLIVQQDAATAIDLQVDKAGGQKGAAGNTHLRPSGGDFTHRCQSDDPAVPDQHRGVGMPAKTVKHPIRQDGLRFGD
jgi:hypothetical protein